MGRDHRRVDQGEILHQPVVSQSLLNREDGRVTGGSHGDQKTLSHETVDDGL